MNDTTLEQGPKVSDELRLATIEVLRERGFAGLTLERVAVARLRVSLARPCGGRDSHARSCRGALSASSRRTSARRCTPCSPRAAPAASGSSAGSKLCAICWTATSRLCWRATRRSTRRRRRGASRLPPSLHSVLARGCRRRLAPALEDPVAAADLAFNTVAWPYVHLRGRHEWPADVARARIVDLVVCGIASADPRRRHEEKESR